MNPILLRTDSDGPSYSDGRLSDVWDSVNKKLTFITPSIWISKLHDHKGCLMVTWNVKPTKALIKVLNDIWVKDCQESEIEHHFNERQIK